MDNIENEMALFSIPADLVYRDFQMNPSTDDLIFGDDLKEGMIVLVEDTLTRTDPSREQGPNADGFWTAHILEQSRWCKIEQIRMHSQNGEIIQFVALYADGTKRKRTYNKSYAWYVKKDSLPKAEDSIYRSAREDFAKIIAQETSGIVGAIPEQEDIELADKFIQQVAGRFEEI